ANKRDLSARVSAVLDLRQRRGRASSALIVSIGLASVALISAMASIRLVAQDRTSSSQAFESVAIRPCEPAPASGRAGGAAYHVTPGRIQVECMRVADMVRRAYVQFGDPPPVNVPSMFDPDVVKGGPAWAYTDRYSIEAKADGTPAGAAMMGAMLRAVL